MGRKAQKVYSTPTAFAFLLRCLIFQLLRTTLAKTTVTLLPNSLCCDVSHGDFWGLPFRKKSEAPDDPMCILFFSFFFVFLFFLEGGPPHSIWRFQARDQVQAAVPIYAAAEATLDPLTHCAGPGTGEIPLSD